MNASPLHRLRIPSPPSNVRRRIFLFPLPHFFPSTRKRCPAPPVAALSLLGWKGCGHLSRLLASFSFLRCLSPVNVALLRLPPFDLAERKNLRRISGHLPLPSHPRFFGAFYFLGLRGCGVCSPPHNPRPSPLAFPSSVLFIFWGTEYGYRQSHLYCPRRFSARLFCAAHCPPFPFERTSSRTALRSPFFMDHTPAANQRKKHPHESDALDIRLQARLRASRRPCRCHGPRRAAAWRSGR